MIPNTNPLVKQYEYYKVVGFTSNSVVVYLLKSVKMFNKGHADNINYYTYSGDTTGLSQTIYLTPRAGQVSKTVHVTTPGTLSSLLTAYEKETVTNLTVSGNIDSRDVRCMRDHVYSLSVLDLSDANINAYNGTEGTLIRNSFYSGNVMPWYSYHNPSVLVGKSTLKTITLPATISSIERYAFYFCSGLTGNLTIPGSVTSIEVSSFTNCRGLTHLTIGSGVTNIGNHAFSGCEGLQEITVACSRPPLIYSYTFIGVNKETTLLNVPEGSKEAYQAAPYWNQFLRINEVTTGTNEAFMPDQPVNVYADQYGIVVEGTSRDETIALCSLNGAVLQTVRSQGGRIVIPVQRAGFYLVRIASKTFKVVL